ncbi:MAG: aldo/keto reductase [Chloroflexi bacterium]|nr:aldo/keto reductase [Chloroflexota bacterium]
MEYRNLGRTGVKVSPICLGTGFRARPDDATCRATIERAIELGVNFIDCANVYQDGRSERLVGEVLRGRRDQLVATTKVFNPVGEGPNDRGLSRVHILRAIDESLTRLQTDHIDLYLPHLPAFVRALREIGYDGYLGYELCHPLPVVDGQTVGRDFADKNARLACEYLRAVIKDAMR